MSRDKKPEHLGFELSEGEGFNRDRVSVFLLLNLVVQSYAEHQIAGFGGKSEDLGLAAFMRELTGLFQGSYPDVLTERRKVGAVNLLPPGFARVWQIL